MEDFVASTVHCESWPVEITTDQPYQCLFEHWILTPPMMWYELYNGCGMSSPMMWYELYSAVPRKELDAFSACQHLNAKIGARNPKKKTIATNLNPEWGSWLEWIHSLKCSNRSTLSDGDSICITNSGVDNHSILEARRSSRMNALPQARSWKLGGEFNRPWRWLNLNWSSETSGLMNERPLQGSP